MLRLFGLVLWFSFAQSAIAGPGIPDFSFRYVSFASTQPSEAASFLVDYLGASLLAPSDFLIHTNTSKGGGSIQGVRWCSSHSSSSSSSSSSSVASVEELCHDVYFVDDPSKPAGNRPIAEYEKYLHELHRFDVQETWDWYQDWHLCVKVDDVDTLVYRLARDSVPFVTRSLYSFYVEIPGGITLQVLGSTMALVWTEEFNFCRYTNGEGIKDGDPRQPRLLKPLPTDAPPFPEVKPGHMSFFSTQPQDAFNFTLAHSSAAPFDMSEAFADTHRYGDGECAQLAWVQFGDNSSSSSSSSSSSAGDDGDDGNQSPLFQVHFIQQYHKHSGVVQPVPSTERFLERLHQETFAEAAATAASTATPATASTGTATIAGAITLDAYMDYRVGFSVPDLSSFAQHLDATAVPYIALADDGSAINKGAPSAATAAAAAAATATASVLYQIPGGIIFEVFAA